MSNVAADIFRQAARLNLDDPRRVGNVVNVESGCEMFVSGDVHGYRPGLTKLISAAKLDRHPQRRLVLQEIIHSPPEGAAGQDRSVDLMLRAARLKISHPQQVLFIMGNHDVAQVTGNEIVKEGRGVCKAFSEGLNFAFGESSGEVMDAIRDFVMSLPMAIRCPNKVLISHSLPTPSRMSVAGTKALDQTYEKADLQRGGSVYEWTWGRDQTAEQLESLANAMDVSYFVLGHRHAERGYETISDRGLTLSTDSERGFVMIFSGDEPLSAGDISKYLRPVSRLA